MKKKKQMKEFDIEKAKAGAPVCTRDGRPVRIICWDYQGYGQEKEEDRFPIIALLKCDKGERAYVYREDGKCYIHKENELVMAPVKREGWVIIDKGSCFNEIHESKEKAMEFAEREEYNYTAIAHIEWEE